MRTIGCILLVLAIRGVGLHMLRDSVRKNQARTWIQRHNEGQERLKRRQEDMRKRIRDHRTGQRVRVRTGR